MARSSFGGADLGNFFAGLYRQEQQQAEYDARYAEAQAKQAAAEAKYAQQAADAEALDQWRNGLISDEEWLAYIQSRIDATQGDAKENQKWVKTYRQYDRQIADNQAQFNYEQGTLDLAGLLAYHNGVLAEMNPDSQEYRERVAVVNNLVDTQVIKNVNAGSEDIIDRIEAGKATYKDLLAFYKDALSKARPGSALADSLKSEIGKVEDQVRADEYDRVVGKAEYDYRAGKISGKSFGKILRQQAEQFKNSDPGKYYQILEAALAAEKAVTGSGRGGSGGKTTKQKMQDAIDAQRAKVYDRESINKLIEAGATQFVNPDTGKVENVTFSTVAANDKALYREMDRLSELYIANGKPNTAANVQKQKTSYIVTHGQQHNSLPFEQSIQTLMTSMAGDLQSAEDPYAASQSSTFYRQKLGDLIVKAESQTKKTGTTYYRTGTGGRNSTRIVEEGGVTATGKKSLEDQVTSNILTEAKGLLAGLNVLADPGASPQDKDRAMESVGSWGGVAAQAVTTVRVVHDVVQGLADGSHTMVATTNPDTGKVEWQAKRNIKSAPYDVLDPTTGSVQRKQDIVPDIDYNEDSQQLVPIFVDDASGNPVQRWLVADKVTPQYMSTWRAERALTIGNKTYKTGQAIPSKVWDDLSRDEQEAIKASGDIALVPIANGQYLQANVPTWTDSKGKVHEGGVWTYDKVTERWTPGDRPPFRGIETASDQTAFIDDDGNPVQTYVPFAQNGSMPFLYFGSNARGMGAIASAMMAAKQGRKVIDELGKPVNAEDRPDLVPDEMYTYRAFVERTERTEWDTRSENFGVRTAKEQAKTAIKAAQSNFYANRSALREEASEAARGGDEELVAKLEGMARNLGIKLGTPSVNDATGFDISKMPVQQKVPQPPPAESSLPPISVPSLTSSVPVVNAATGFNTAAKPVSTPTLTTRTYSGPTVAPKITTPLPKPTATPRPAPTPAERQSGVTSSTRGTTPLVRNTPIAS